MAPPLRQDTARQIVRMVKKMKGRASFRSILLEANSQGVIADHRTLRRYLDLLVQARVLKVRKRNVGSVNLQQLYTLADSNPHLWTGLAALRLHGLNWEVSDRELYQVDTDLEATVRAKAFTIIGKEKLVAGLEDTLVHELERDAAEQTGVTELVAAMLATRTVDLPYLLRRAGSHQMGQTVRRLIQKIAETFTSLPGDAEGRVYLEARTRFLKILREYNSRGVFKLVETRGVGRRGLPLVKSLSPDQIVSIAGKQYGVQG